MVNNIFISRYYFIFSFDMMLPGVLQKKISKLVQKAVSTVWSVLVLYFASNLHQFRLNYLPLNHIFGCFVSWQSFFVRFLARISTKNWPGNIIESAFKLSLYVKRLLQFLSFTSYIYNLRIVKSNSQKIRINFFVRVLLTV